MSDDQGPGLPTVQRFGRYVTEAARAAGYDIDSPRGSGKLKIARATGMSPSAVGRMLKGETMPSPRRWEALAEALGRPLRDLLIVSGTASEESLAKVAEAAKPPENLTAREAARLLGITIPANVDLFISMVENFLRQEPGPDRTSSGAA